MKLLASGLQLNRCLAASRSMGVRFRANGFAVRCEAVALPRRSRGSFVLGSAPGVAFGLAVEGAEPARRA